MVPLSSALPRSHLEYYSQAQGPHLRKDVDQLAMGPDERDQDN